MRFYTLVALASAIALTSALPNPYPAPTAAVEQRAADPAYCLTDDHGTRCVPDRAKRTAAPEVNEIDAREPKHHKHHKTTKPPKSSPTPTTTSGFYSSSGALCTVEDGQTRCIPNTPRCTTDVVSGTTQVACVL